MKSFTMRKTFVVLLVALIVVEIIYLSFQNSYSVGWMKALMNHDDHDVTNTTSTTRDHFVATQRTKNPQESASIDESSINNAHVSNNESNVLLTRPQQQEQVEEVEMKENTHKEKSKMCLMENHTLFHNKIIQRDDVNETVSSDYHRMDKGIPKVFHFFAKSKCVPNQIYQNLERWVEAVPDDYSIYLYDLEEIQTYLSKPRSDSMYFIRKAYSCAFHHEAILDLARLVYLYDFGGISVDLDHIPGEGFFQMKNGTQLLLFHEYPTEDGKPLSYVVEEQTAHAYPRFLAASAQYPMLYKSLLKCIYVQYTQHLSHLPVEWTYNGTRNITYHTALDQLISKKQHNTPIDLMYHAKFAPGGVVQKMNGTHFLEQVPLTAQETNGIRLNDDENIKYCVNLQDNSYKIEVDELLEIVGIQNNKTCSNDTIYESNVFLPESINIPGRKIPNVVHMTAKTRCFTESYHQNNNLWKLPGHSFFMHDNDAVYKLFHKYDWDEFPLLNETLACINSGAMLADIWRYLLMWKFGGIYSDVDDSPGYAWANATFIEDDMDAIFEVERGGKLLSISFSCCRHHTHCVITYEKHDTGFPSQYFFAMSPHHPVAYFMMSHALDNLFSSPRPLFRRAAAPFITGPRACKNGVMMSIGGNGYPQHGEYHGVYDRNITIIGSRQDARQGKYLRRGNARKVSPADDEKKMGMEHYQGPTDVQLPSHKCHEQILMNLGVSMK